MSTKEPLQSASCPESCETGWRSSLCKIKSFVCRLQKIIDPLCETEDKPLGFEGYKLARKWVDDRTSRMMTPIYPNTSAELKAMLDKYEADNLAEYKELRKASKGRLTLLNRIGMVFAYGTSCVCCVAYRAYLLAIAAFIAGAVLL